MSAGTWPARTGVRSPGATAGTASRSTSPPPSRRWRPCARRRPGTNGRPNCRRSRSRSPRRRTSPSTMRRSPPMPTSASPVSSCCRRGTGPAAPTPRSGSSRSSAPASTATPPRPTVIGDRPHGAAAGGTAADAAIDRRTVEVYERGGRLPPAPPVLAPSGSPRCGAAPGGRVRIDLGSPGHDLAHLGTPTVAADAAPAMVAEAGGTIRTPALVADLAALLLRRGSVAGVWASKRLQHVARPGCRWPWPGCTGRWTAAACST